MTARVSMLLKSRASLTCFRACFLPGRAKDLSAHGICVRNLMKYMKEYKHGKWASYERNIISLLVGNFDCVFYQYCNLLRLNCFDHE